MPRAKQIAELNRHEWNFDEVPEDELVACCYWEYARESVFIDDVRRRCLDPQWKTMVKTELHKYVGKDIETIQSIGYPSEVIVRGIFCPPEGVLDDAPRLQAGEVHRQTGSFPKPWQALRMPERAYRKCIGSDVTKIPLVPFERGVSLDAQDIREWTLARQAETEAARQTVQRENPKLREGTLNLMDGKTQVSRNQTRMVLGQWPRGDGGGNQLGSVRQRRNSELFQALGQTEPTEAILGAQSKRPQT